MAKVSADALGTEPIGKLLVKQAVPAAIGILVMSLNILVDTIFVGNWIGAVAIAAINIVLPVSFFIAAIGMAIGIGGSSVISRALGASDKERALFALGNQITLTLLISITLVIFGLIYVDFMVDKFGGKGAIFDPAKIYYTIVLYGVPILALCMMGNNVIRAEGKPKFAMIAMIIPSVGNLLMDYILINVLDMGMAGAAWATTTSYVFCFIYIVYFFLAKSELRFNLRHLQLQPKIVSEIAALGSTTLARQGVVSIVYLLMNNTLVELGGESTVTAYAIVSRMLMFALFPVIGITQGFLPIAGYNYGAEEYGRVKETIFTAIKYASFLATIIFIILFVFPEPVTKVFTTDAEVIEQTPGALRWVFAATPMIAIQLIGAAYFQAVGKAFPALMLTLSKQGFFLIPLIIILPKYMGVLGAWVSFPIADVLSTLVTALFLNREIRKTLNSKIKLSLKG
ncbi:MATE family efflux transporter [Leptobacterium flavescens]|uniref:Multidrug export protein MepA n=1 Tax=Leptobacterium flavescens TaxID=472055 RepID=A0A6P0UIK0_9FLAO|nr:MATE family efflux transporter [Leptobacterium flavescens]NER13125.1 MATE family efflux transporter [Leptobacterium flavescens]